MKGMIRNRREADRSTSPLIVDFFVVYRIPVHTNCHLGKWKVFYLFVRIGNFLLEP